MYALYTLNNVSTVRRPNLHRKLPTNNTATTTKTSAKVQAQTDKAVTKASNAFKI